jgi:hypothetical protein
MKPLATLPAEAGGSSAPALERQYSPSEIAELWSLDTSTVRRIFQDRSDVFKWSSGKKGKRAYETLRIPESTLVRVYRERSR